MDLFLTSLFVPVTANRHSVSAAGTLQPPAANTPLVAPAIRTAVDTPAAPIATAAGASLQPANAFAVMMNNPRRAERNQVPFKMIELMPKTKIFKMRLSHFLFLVARHSINLLDKQVKIFSIRIEPQQKSRILLAYHFVRLHANEEMWREYEKVGRAFSNAYEHKTQEQFGLEKQLQRICAIVTNDAADIYFKKLQATEAYITECRALDADKKKKKDEGHMATARTLGLGSRLEKLHWTYK